VYIMRRQIKRDKLILFFYCRHLGIMCQRTTICSPISLHKCISAIPGRKNYEHFWSRLCSGE
jgi:hypothetical protein